MSRLVCLGLVAAAVTAHAGRPFGGDDTGFAPPDAITARCEDRVAKQVAKFVGALVRCHTKAADAGVGQRPFAEEGCEQTAKAKYQATITTLLVPSCPPCLFTPDVGGAEATRALIDQSAGVVYCAGTTPLGGDDTGWVPPDRGTATCEDGVARNLSRFVVAATTCHVQLADSRVHGTPGIDDEPCESAAQAKYDAANRKLPGCPACLDAPAVGQLARLLVEGNNGDVYCASPGGAFVE